MKIIYRSVCILVAGMVAGAWLAQNYFGAFRVSGWLAAAWAVFIALGIPSWALTDRIERHSDQHPTAADLIDKL